MAAFTEGVDVLEKQQAMIEHQGGLLAHRKVKQLLEAEQASGA